MDKFTLSNHDSAILDGVGWVCLDANLWQLSSSIFSPFRDATMRSVHTAHNRSSQSFEQPSWVYKPNPRSRKIVSVALHEFPLTQICDTNFHFWARIWLRMRSKSSQIWERARAYHWHVETTPVRLRQFRSTAAIFNAQNCFMNFQYCATIWIKIRF